MADERRVCGVRTHAGQLAVTVQVRRVVFADALGMNPMHQQPPKMPLLRSTNAANAGHIDSSSGRTL
jgi:hypothetical protein